MREDVQVLLVEDDVVEAESIRRAFRKGNAQNVFSHALDGVQALEVLRGPLDRPNLVLLDLNLPRMNGLEFLDEVRKDEDLKDIVIFILSTSDEEGDKIAAYEKNVSGYLVKSKLGENFIKLVNMLDSYSSTIEFPPDRDSK